ncbi:hypothetical protein JL722_14767 [Aureococcus anophagefferens]|nr:hypothetical protein JL722_14767 [Aureococcus anophagefferens]
MPLASTLLLASLAACAGRTKLRDEKRTTTTTHATTTTTPPTRFVFSHHKTGHVLAHRLVARINEGGESASHAGTWFGQGVDDNVTSFPKLGAYFAHRCLNCFEGALRPGSRVVNVALLFRDLGRGGDLEPFTRPEALAPYGLPPARSRDESYVDYLGRLDTNRGLLAEMVRVDAWDLHEAVESVRTTRRYAGFHSVCLERFMGAKKGFDDAVADVLRWLDVAPRALAAAHDDAYFDGAFRNASREIGCGAERRRRRLRKRTKDGWAAEAALKPPKYDAAALAAAALAPPPTPRRSARPRAASSTTSRGPSTAPRARSTPVWKSNLQPDFNDWVPISGPWPRAGRDLVPEVLGAVVGCAGLALGAKGDGGKWICDPDSLFDERGAHPCAILSVGSNDDFTFERALIKAHGCLVRLRPHAETAGLRGEKHCKWCLDRSKIKFFKHGLAPRPDASGTFVTLGHMVKTLARRGLGAVSLAKIDCEGCEFDVFREPATQAALRHVLHLNLEVHFLLGGEAVANADRVARMAALWADVAPLMVPFSKEPNIQFAPDCVEYAFVNAGAIL